jgi:hypothetical protein
MVTARGEAPEAAPVVAPPGAGDMVEPDTAAAVAAHLAARTGAAASFLAGSLVEGFGTPTSDVDVYLLSDDDVPGRRQYRFGATRVDAHLMSWAYLAATLDRLSATVLASDGTAPPPEERDLVLAARLWTSRPVTGAAALVQVRERVVFPRLRQLVAHARLTTVHTALEDYAGLRAVGDLDGALQVARVALLAAAKAVAATEGEVYPGDKWAFRQLARSAPPEFPLATLVRLHRGDPATGPAWLSELASFVQLLARRVATLGWQHVPAAAWPAWPDGASAAAGGTRGTLSLTTVPDMFPRPFDDGVVLTRPGDRRVRLSHDVALVWALCDGVSEAELVTRAASLRDAAEPFRHLTPGRCRDVLGRLESRDLVRRRD